MGKRKNVKFQYFEVCSINENGEEHLFDLLSWLELVQPLQIQDRIKTIKNIVGRHENTRRMDTNFYALNFMRMEDSSNTYKVKHNETAQHIDLEEDEYIGKNTVALYDAFSHVLMVQINRGGFGVTEIETYINSFMVEPNLCYLRPIFHQFNVEDCLNKNTVKLEVRFANLARVECESSDFENIIDSCRNMDAVTAKIELGLGKSPIETLNRETISLVASDIQANREHISSAKIKINDHIKSVMFDMFENIEHDFISFTIEPRGELAFEFVSDKMVEKFGSSRGRVLNNLQGED